MRIRTIKPEFFKHDKLSELSPIVRILFVGLWCMADRSGRLEDRPKRIKAEVLPYDDFDVDRGLSELAQHGFISRYEFDGIFLIEIANFEKHQRITGKEAETQSEYPPASSGKPRGNNRETTGKHPRNNGETTETTGREGKGKEGKGSLPPNFLAGGCDEDGLPGIEAAKPDEPAQAEPVKPAKHRQRDPLFDALASIDGSNPIELTSTQARACGVALAEIRKATPTVTPDEIRRRAENYRAHFREAALTPSALKCHWSRCANLPPRANGGHVSQLKAEFEADGTAKW